MKIKIISKPPKLMTVRCPNCYRELHHRTYGTNTCNYCKAVFEVSK